MHNITIGMDIAKSVFQVHGVDKRTGTVIKKRLARSKLLGFFAKLEPSPDRHGSVLDIASLGARA